MLRICILGLGYIGLPTAALLASFGQEVIGVDINSHLLELLGEGGIHINEPELQPMIIKSISSQSLKLRSAPEKSDAFIVAVPTPYNEAKSCDLNSVTAAVNSIIPYLEPGNLIIVESTVPPGTCADLVQPLLEMAGFKTGEDIHLAFCPERVLPGQILKELVENSRIIGGYTHGCAVKAAGLYRIFVKNEIILTDLRTAEMVKLVENTYRDVNIALANEFTVICNQLGINAVDVIELANHHPRVNILQPGPGVGGHCLAVDPYFIVEKAPSLAGLISMARVVNNRMPVFVVAQVKILLSGLEQPKIAVLGLSYKGNVADLRESPAAIIVNLLKQAGFRVMVHDPLFGGDEITNHVETVVKDADLILILTDHEIFRTYDYLRLAEQMRSPVIFDTRSIINSQRFNNTKIVLYNLGNIYTVNKDAFPGVNLSTDGCAIFS
ncbi:MAG: nucleotide sugar dehydrogenase [Syntrophomonadaceae bacterium]|nr:nucleotide sugar dehydrogenase [Syntrophomonadaceae bacterium]